VPPRQPDIVLFMTDQQRFDQWGLMDSHFETPALDALAREGVVFEQAYSASSTCVPARTGLLTGAQPHRVPTKGNSLFLREGTWTLAHALRASGYETALVGKMHFSPIHADHGFDVMRTCEHLVASEIVIGADGVSDFDDYHNWLLEQGLAEYRPLPDSYLDGAQRTPTPFPYDLAAHPTSWVEAEAGDVLDRRSPDRPLFLVVSFPHPHPPLDPAEPYASLFDPSNLAPPDDGFEVNRGLPEPFLRELEGTTGIQPKRTDAFTTRQLQRRLNKTRALVRHIDDAMGRLLARLPPDRTLVFFTTDHGDYAGHRGLLQKVPWIPFDDLVRVPLVVAGPGVRSEARVRSLVQAFDIVPTACAAAGVDVDHGQFDARSLWPHLAGAADDSSDAGDGADDERFVVFTTTLGWPGVRIGSLKYVRHRPSGEAVLFDLDDDAGETRNLLDDPAYRPRAFDLAVTLQLVLDRPTLDLPSARELLSR
jgi:choline-sulfatase